MNTLQRYLLRQVIVALVTGTIVLAFVLLLSNTLKQVLELVIAGAIDLKSLATLMLSLIPFVLMYALPIAMLTSVLLVFGRFSADNELTAARTSGISLVSLIWPLLAFALLLSISNILIATEFAPRARARYKELLLESRAKLAQSLLPERRFVTEFPGLIVYVGKHDRGQVKDVLLYFVRDGTNIFAKLRAPSGELSITGGVFTLRLQNVRGVFHARGQWYPSHFGEWIWQTNLLGDGKTTKSIGLRHMTARQLISEIKRLEKLTSDSESGSEQNHVNITLPLRVQLHRQFAFGFATFAFTLMGIPLGVFMHRRETNVSAAMAIVIVLVYYVLMSLGESFDSRPQMHPEILIWIPNFLFQILGVLLLKKANE